MSFPSKILLTASHGCLTSWRHHALTSMWILYIIWPIGKCSIERQVKCGIISHSFFDLGQTFLEILNMGVDAPIF